MQVAVDFNSQILCQERDRPGRLCGRDARVPGVAGFFPACVMRRFAMVCNNVLDVYRPGHTSLRDAVVCFIFRALKRPATVAGRSATKCR